MNPFYLDCFLPVRGMALSRALELNQLLVENFASQIDFKQSIEPHLTVFMGLFPDLKPVQTAINKLNRDFMAFSVSLNGFRLSSDGYLFWEAVADKDLQTLHETVIKVLNPLRAGLFREKFLEDRYNESERKNINEYGFPWVRELFKPHLTLARLPGIVAKKELFALLANFSPDCEFEAERLQLGEVGENGTVKA